MELSQNIDAGKDTLVKRDSEPHVTHVLGHVHPTPSQTLDAAEFDILLSSVVACVFTSLECARRIVTFLVTQLLR